MIQPSSPSVGATPAPRYETQLSDEPVYASHLAPPARVTWWSAILAGAVAAIALQVIFAVLGTAIGLSVLSAADNAPEVGLSIGAVIYWLITGLISLFAGGFIASRFRNTSDGNIGAMHGFLTWCTVTVLSAVMLAMASGTAIGGSLAVVGEVMSGANRPLDRNVQIDSASNDRSVLSNDPRLSGLENADRDSRTVTPEERKDAAEQAAKAAWWTLIGLVLGATVATVGGKAGIRDVTAHTRTVTRSSASH